MRAALFSVGRFLVVLAAFTGLTSAQQTGERRPAAEQAGSAKPSANVIAGKIIAVNTSERTFTLVAKGKEYKFGFRTLASAPKIGALVDVTYTGNPGGPMEATNLNSSRSN